MGQKCCKPAMRVDKKHKFLLNLIYKQTRQNVSNLNHRQISEYLAKKGYIKTLCDYLSSHLNQISPSVRYCKDQQQQAWKQQPKIQLFFCCITGQILIKIVRLCKQVKMKHMSKSKRLSVRQDAEEINSRIKSSFTQKVASKVSELKRSQKRRTHDELHEANIYLEQQVTSSMIIETCNQMLKQTIFSKSPSSSQKSMLSNQSRAELTDRNEYHILTKVQNILFVLLQSQDSLLKIDNIVLKQILDSQIYIAVQDANKVSQQISMKRNYVNRNSQQAPSPYVLQNIVKSPNKLQRQSRQFQIGNAYSKTGLLQRKAFPHFYFHQQQFQKLRIASLKNYEMLFKKYNSQLVSTSLYKNVVKEHLPLLLERWTKLIIDTDDQENSLSLSGISEKINESIFESKGSVTQAKNEKNLKTIEKLINSIILEFFSGYFSFGESEYLYRELTLIFDKLYFSRSKIQPIEQLVFKALKKFDLRQSVVSKWFEYLLNYLGIITTTVNHNQNWGGTLNDKRVNQQQESINYFSEMNMQLNFNTDKIDYIHWSNQESVIGCLRTIQRWIQLKQVVLEDILMFKRTKFFVAILCNLAWGQNKISQQIYNIVCFLVSQDIRCQGYLVSTSIYLIQRAKVNQNNQGQNEWEFFYNGWKKKHYTIRFKQNQQEQSRFIKSNDKQKQSLNTKSRNFRLTLTDLINIQRFLDQIICLACYPFLTELYSRIPEDNTMGIEEWTSSKKWASHMLAGNQNQNQLILARRQSEQIRRSETGLKKLQHRSSLITKKVSQIKVHEILETHYNFYLAKKQVFFFVFEQIIEILFGQINFEGSSRTGECSKIKLCGLFLVSNFATMMALIGKSKVEKQKLSCVFNIMNKINNFMAKVYHQLRVAVENQEGSNYKQTYDSQLFYSYNRLEISKQMNVMQDSIDKLPKHRRRQKTLSFLSSSIHKWIYPAFSHILLPTEFEKIFLRKENPQKNPNQDQITTILHSKILLNFSVKLYFINLVNLVLENYEGYHIARDNRKAGEDGSQSGKQRRNSNFFNIGDSDDNINKISQDSINKHQKGFILNFFVPVIEIYELMLEFNQKYNMYKQTKTFIQQKIDEQEKEVITSKTEKGQKENKSKLQEKNRKLDDLKLEKNISEMILKIKKNRQDYKRLQSKQDNSYENRQKSRKFANSFLDVITHVQQYQINEQNGNLSGVSEQHVLNEAESIIGDQNICPYMFYLVDCLTKYAFDFNKSEEALVFDNQATFKKGQSYLMKQLRKVVIVEEVEVRSKCDWFKRSNKKQSKVYKAQNSGIKQQKNIQNSLQKTTDTKFSQESNSQHLWLPLVKNQQTQNAIQRIIQKFEQKYKVGNRQKRGPSKQASSSGATKVSGWLHISQGDFQIEQSSKKSSQLDSKRVEQDSLKQVLQQIRKH